MSLSESRLQSLLDGVNSMSRKVYEFVPIQEAWNIQQINAAIVSKSSMRVDYKTIRACVGDLKDRGIIRGTSQGYFQRIVPTRLSLPRTDKEAHNEEEKTMSVSVTDKSIPTASVSAGTALDALSTLSAELGAFSVEFNTRLHGFAKRLEDVALLVEEEREQNAVALKKYNALKNVLKEISG